MKNDILKMLSKKRLEKKNIIILIGIIITTFIMILIIRNITKISTDNYLYGSMIGDDKSHARHIMYNEKESLQEFNDFDIYENQSFFGMNCKLYFYYDKNNKIKQITYYKDLDDDENVENFQKNINAIIDYYSNVNNNTKGCEPNIIEFDEYSYQYSWRNVSGSNYYDLEIDSCQISMTVM